MTLAALWLSQGAAPAQAAPSSGDAARAEALFRKARRLMQEGKAGEACPLLEESQKLDPGGGTLLNLAECHASVGKTATAFRELGAVIELARGAGRVDAEKTATESREALRPKLSWLTVEVPAYVARTAGLVLESNGAPLARKAWGIPEPVDPGRYALVARAPGRLAWSRTVTVGPNGDRQVVWVELPPAPPAPRVDTAPPATSSTSTWRLAGGIGGFAAGGVMIGLAVFSMDQVDAAQHDKKVANYAAKYPSSTNICDQATTNGPDHDSHVADQCDKASTFEVAQFVFLGGAVVLGGAGVYLLATATGPSPAQGTQVSVMPYARETGAGLRFSGSF